MRSRLYLSSIILLAIWVQISYADHGGFNLPDPYTLKQYTTSLDTIPIQDSDASWTDDNYYNPFDITPSIVTQEVEYDPETGNYIILEKIGDEYFRTPSYMTFGEYLEWNKKKQEQEYFSQLAGLNTGKKSDVSAVLDPMSRVDVGTSLVDRLFGGTEVNIQPQGNVDLSFGMDYQSSNDETISERQRTRKGFDFDMAIRMNVDGSIGEKLNLGFNYDTQSTFDFDRKIKLEYDSEAFSDDSIIKKIEAGNVSMPLRSTLIQGAQSLFGLKTELQFGNLRLTALASQQRSKQNNIRIENGASVQEFELQPDDYDENRHFFVSHYHRDTYERALSNLPFVNSSFRIANIEVWISDDRPVGGNGQQNDFTQIAAIADLATPDISNYTNPNTMHGPIPQVLMNSQFQDLSNLPLPDNRVNGLYEQLSNDEQAKEIDKTAEILRTDYGMRQTRDFEVFRGRKLSSSEFTYNEQLGMISLNVRLRPNQVLGVAYNYFYTAKCDEVYNVGELANEGSLASNYSDVDQTMPQDSVEAPKLFFVKLLKSTNQNTQVSTWDLMMKNVYSLRTNQLNREDFEFDIFYDDPADGAPKKFLPEPGFRDRALLEVFELDRLNEYNDPQQDGVFDFVEGITVNSRTGSVIFPVLEPFGSSLTQLLGPALAEEYAYEKLYDTSVTIARYNFQHKNRFIMRGKVKSSVSGEISLGPFVPEGSVRVTAGGVQLQEGADFEIDYALGRLRIINDAILAQGTPINVNFEDNTVFSLQQKTMIGLRADYEISDNFNVGGTFLRLTERPFTPKVNLGDDPIANKIYGLDMEYSNEAPWMTRALDKLPFFSTKEASNINFAAEVAALRPGHSSAIQINTGDNEAVAIIDDFEGAASGFLIGSFNTNIWSLSSTPTGFEERSETGSNLANVNRARFNWYSIDLSQTNGTSPYTRLVRQQDLFEDRDVVSGQNNLTTFDMSFYPDERGPYNFDLPDGTDYSAGAEFRDGDIRLDDPESRWGGIMRNFRNTDFEAANYQFIEFWMLNPYMDRPDGREHDLTESGEIVFQLGSISEDVLADNLQFYENSMPVPGEEFPLKTTSYGQVPVTIPVTKGFDRVNGQVQDVGFDGMNDEQEREKHADYIDKFVGVLEKEYLRADPAADNFLAFNDPSLDGLDRLTQNRRASNPEGNLPNNSNNSNPQDFVRGNRLPDTEDLNGNYSLDLAESYHQYKLPIKNIGGELDTTSSYIKQVKIVQPDGNGPAEKWYRVQIPLSSGTSINGIQGFRAIQFMRIYMTKFKSAKTFRLAEFELVRNIWRQSFKEDCEGGDNALQFGVDDVGLEENSSDLPFNYVTPPGIDRERVFNSFAALRQDEKSLELAFQNLSPDCYVAINKLANLNLTFYDRLQMFTHLEQVDTTSSNRIENGDLAAFIRIGEDSESNYYEMRVPLNVSRDTASINDKDVVWPEANRFNVELDKLTELKVERNKSGSTFSEEFVSTNDPNLLIKGNPSLAEIREVEIGVINVKDGAKSGNVWVNELRATGFKEKGGYAATARMQMQMADLGELNAAATYTSEGWGGLDQRLQERNQFSKFDYDIATSLELSKFLPSSLGLQIPFYAQYSKSIKSPRFEPYSGDLTIDQAVESGEDRTIVEARSQETTTIKSFNFTNVKKTSSGKSTKPWSPGNFSASYAYTETLNTDPIIEEDRITEHTGGLDYNYSRKSSYIKPLKFIKGNTFKILSELNFNPLPSSFTFNTRLNRKKSTRSFRLPDSPRFTFDDRRFVWDRNYGLNWDLAKSLKLTYKANASAVVDELRQIGIKTDPNDRDWVDESGNIVTPEVLADPNYVSSYRWNNLKNLGRSKNYDHSITATYTLPLKHVKALDWVTAKADYKAGYSWQGGALIKIDTTNLLGNTIANNQTRTATVSLAFDKLYSRIPYLKNIDKGAKNRRSRSRSGGRTKAKSNNKDDMSTGDGKTKDKKQSGPSTIEKILVRPLMSIRDVKFTFKEDRSTYIPGFMPQSQLLGMESGFGAPGWGFILGDQPELESFLFDNVENDWFNPSLNFSDEIVQTKRHNLDVKIGLEPFKDFNIDIDFKKNYQETHTEVFKKVSKGLGEGDFMRNAGYDIGSFEASYSGLSTLFNNNSDLYANFLSLRKEVSQQLANDATGSFSSDFPDYAVGYGPDNSRVVIPAFLGAYTGKSIDQININETLDQSFADYSYFPKPNWNISYDGLSKLSMFKDIISNFSLKHGYKSSIKVNSFNSTPEYDAAAPFANTKANGNYYSRVEIPNISINEQFAPLFGLTLKTKKDLQLNAEFRKSRRLDLAIAAGNLTEVLGTEYILGFGYTIKDFQGFFGRGSKKRGKRGKRGEKDAEKEDTDPLTGNKGRRTRGRGGNVQNNRGRNLTFNFDFAYSDDVTWIYRYKEELNAQPQRGQTRLFINPYVDYEMDKNLTLRFFFEYTKTKPYSRTSFDRTNMEGGITVQFKLN